jgi:hypothetical protein
MRIAIPHLHDLWRRICQENAQSLGDHWVADNTLLSGLGLNLQETLRYLYLETPTRDQFEQWVIERNGGAIRQERIDRINAALEGRTLCEPVAEPVLTANDLDFWDRNGYVVVHDAVPPQQCLAAARAIYDFLGADPEHPATWYRGPQGHSIWVPLLQHPALVANRSSPRIHGAFAQLWGTGDLWMNTDQAGFNPPEREDWPFPGPHLHWDTSLDLPVPFGVQGILYLTDTPAEQGAFQCVPGFHRRIEDWVRSLPQGANPRDQDLTALGAVPIAGRAGDLIVWHHALPHGASPNRGERPRVVQYLAMRPSQWGYAKQWK